MAGFSVALKYKTKHRLYRTSTVLYCSLFEWLSDSSEHRCNRAANAVYTVSGRALLLVRQVWRATRSRGWVIDLCGWTSRGRRDVDDGERAFCIFIFYIFYIYLKTVGCQGGNMSFPLVISKQCCWYGGGGWFNHYSLSPSQVKSIWLTGCLSIHYSVICMSSWTRTYQLTVWLCLKKHKCHRSPVSVLITISRSTRFDTLI